MIKADSLKQIYKIIIVIILILPLILYGWQVSSRPPLTNTEDILFKGISYRRNIYSVPRTFITHIIEIDLTIPGLKPFVTPPKLNKQNLAQTTSSFIEEYNLQLAVNGSFFYPFYERLPWDYYPKVGQPVNALGQSITDNVTYGDLAKRWKILCFGKNNLARIKNKKKCPQGTVQGIAGMDILVKDGRNNIKSNTPAYPRTVVATNKQGTKLWLIVADGKQPFYSEGVTLKEIAEIAISLGADTALNLDGGGSTTLAINNGLETKIINAPIHSKIPMNERPVANHLGFYALPVN